MAVSAAALPGPVVLPPGGGVSALPNVTRVGPVVVTGPCQPTQVVDGFGFIAPCAVRIRNVSRQTVLLSGSTQPISAPGPVAVMSGRSVGPLTLAPGQVYALPDPPPGQAWVVVVMTQGGAKLLAWGLVGGAFVFAGLAGYGAYAAVRDLRHRGGR